MPPVAWDCCPWRAGPWTSGTTWLSLDCSLSRPNSPASTRVRSSVSRPASRNSPGTYGVPRACFFSIGATTPWPMEIPGSRGLAPRLCEHRAVGWHLRSDPQRPEGPGLEVASEIRSRAHRHAGTRREVHHPPGGGLRPAGGPGQLHGVANRAFARAGSDAPPGTSVALCWRPCAACRNGRPSSSTWGKTGDHGGPVPHRPAGGQLTSGKPPLRVHVHGR